MQSRATTPAGYLAELPPDRKKVIAKLRAVIKKNLPKGFKEGLGYGMIAYSVPLALYPDGYHCNPAQPLPFMNVASQKNFVALYHMGLYADKKLLDWFTHEYPKHSKKKLDMGKSCIRFKTDDDVPYALIGELCAKMSVNDWIKIYETMLRR